MGFVVLLNLLGAAFAASRGDWAWVAICSAVALVATVVKVRQANRKLNRMIQEEAPDGR